MSLITVLLFLATLASAHTVITYPGWRGDNLKTTGTPPAYNPDTVGVDYVNGTYQFPYGQEWIYPCGGMPMSTNRTKWPVTGGAVAFQTGWFAGHALALIYINIGINGPGDLAPPNMSHPVVPPFQITGPSNDLYPGTVCLPQVPLPPNLQFSVGDNLTIQVIETAQHGAALYNCVDVTLVEPEDAIPVTKETCFNTSSIGFQYLFTTTSLSSAGGLARVTVQPVLVGFMALLAILVGTVMG